MSEKLLGPFEIIAQHGKRSFTLKLPDHLKGIHPIFHVSMLEPHHNNPFPGQKQPPPPPILVEEEPEYEIKEILDSKYDCRFKDSLRYLVSWQGYEGTDEETSWLGSQDLEHAIELVNDFHQKYPHLPKIQKSH